MSFLQRFSSTLLSIVSPDKSSESTHIYPTPPSENTGEKRKRIDSSDDGDHHIRAIGFDTLAAYKRRRVVDDDSSIAVTRADSASVVQELKDLRKRTRRMSLTGDKAVCDASSTSSGAEDEEQAATNEQDSASEFDEADIDGEGSDIASDSDEIRISIEQGDEHYAGSEEDINIASQDIYDEEEEEEEDEGDTTLLDQRAFSLTTDNPDNLVDQGTQIIRGPEDLGQPHLCTAALQAQGWDDDYILLLHKIIMRGYEPLLPAYMKFEFQFLPDALFVSRDDDDSEGILDDDDREAAFLGIPSIKDRFHASKHFAHLLELSSRVRDCVTMEEFLDVPRAPEEVVRKDLGRYFQFLQTVAGLDAGTSIPILTFVTASAGTSTAQLRAAATRKCAALADRWQVRLAEHNVGGDVIPEPTIYAIVASHTVVALMAYKRRQHHGIEAEIEAETDCEGMAILDLSKDNNDVWDALALACVGFHVTNVMVKYAALLGDEKLSSLAEVKPAVDMDAVDA